MFAAKCQDAFTQGKNDRVGRSLPSGMYKLVETRNCWKTYTHEIERIRLYLIGERSPYSLRHCTSEDFHRWVRDAFLWKAYDVGYNIFPAVAALSADGVPKQVIADVQRILQASWPNLLRVLDSAHRSLKTNQQVEFDLINLDKSRAYGALNEGQAWLYFPLNDLPQDLFARVYPEELHAEEAHEE